MPVATQSRKPPDMASLASPIASQVSRRTIHYHSGNSSTARNGNPAGASVIARLDPRVKTLERELQRCQQQIVRLQLVAEENKELRTRLARLRRLKLTAEEGIQSLRMRQKAATRTMIMQIRDHEKYADHCVQLYENALDTVQKLVKITHAGQKWLTHQCPGCGPKPIIDFAMRTLPSGDLGFRAYCQVCWNKRKSSGRKVLDMDIKEVAANLVDKSPRIARQMVERFEEEVEELVRAEQDRER